MVPFQGYLTGADGKAVADSDRTVQFRLFDAPVGGALVWTGEVHRLSVNGGLVNTILGTRVAIPSEYGDSVPTFSRPLYLEITVDSEPNGTIDAADPPLLPRQALLPSVFATNAADAQTLNGFDWSEILLEKAEDPSETKIDGRRIGMGTVDFPVLNPRLQNRINSLESKVNALELLVGQMKRQFNFQVLGNNFELSTSGAAGFDYQSRGGRVLILVSISGRAANVTEGGNVGIEFRIRVNDTNGNNLGETSTSHWFSHQARTSAHTFPTAVVEVSGAQNPGELRVLVARAFPAEGEANFGATQRVSVVAIEFPAFD